LLEKGKGDFLGHGKLGGVWIVQKEGMGLLELGPSRKLWKESSLGTIRTASELIRVTCGSLRRDLRRTAETLRVWSISERGVDVITPGEEFFLTKKKLASVGLEESEWNIKEAREGGD